MKAICFLLAAALGQDGSRGHAPPAPASDFALPSSVLAYQQPPGGFGGGPGFGMPMGSLGMGRMNGMGMGVSNGTGMPNGMTSGGMGMTSGMGMAGMNGTRMSNTSAMGLNGGWNQVAQQVQGLDGIDDVHPPRGDPLPRRPG